MVMNTLTFRTNPAPLRVREFVLTIAYSLLHSRRDGCSMIAVEWWVAAQPEQRMMLLKWCVVLQFINSVSKNIIPYSLN